MSFPSAVVQGAARRKNDLCEGTARVTGTIWKANSHFETKPKRVRGSHYHVEEAVDWCRLLIIVIYTAYDCQLMVIKTKTSKKDVTMLNAHVATKEPEYSEDNGKSNSTFVASIGLTMHKL